MRLLQFLAAVVVLSGLNAAVSGQTIDELKAENLELRKKLAVVTMNQLKEVALFCHEYAAEHDGKFPKKPSDLRAMLSKHNQWWKLVAAYDEHPSELRRRLDTEDKLWKWMDENSSFVFVDGVDKATRNDPLIKERNPVFPGHMAIAFRDGHTEIREIKK